jgi:hypothetical protein
MHSSIRWMAGGGLMLAGLLAAGAAPAATTAPKAALVESVAPSKPWRGVLQATLLATAPTGQVVSAQTGPGPGQQLVVTAMTLTNLGSNTVLATLMEPNQFVDSPSCAARAPAYGYSVDVVLVPPMSSVHLTYPSGLVLGDRANVAACIDMRLERGSNLERPSDTSVTVSLSGYVN